jgi:hypothetical protein
MKSYIFKVSLIEISLVHISDDDEYFTPPSTPEKLSRSESPSYSDDDANMLTPDEGPDVFIQG